jgi:hypothetical protein
MVDNVTVTNRKTSFDNDTNADIPVATDDVGGQQYQRVKVDLGGDGVSSPLVRGQQSKANSLPVTLATDEDALAVTDNGGSLTVDGTVSAAAVTFSSLTASNVSVDTTATGVEILAANGSRESAEIANLSTTLTVFVNGGSATTSDFPIQPGQKWPVPKGYTGQIKGITSSGTADVRAIEGS